MPINCKVWFHYYCDNCGISLGADKRIYFSTEKKTKFTSKLVFTFILEVTILEISVVIVLAYDVFVRSTLLFSEELSFAQSAQHRV